MSGIWAVVPIKEFSGAKQRLTPRLSPQQRQSLAAIMVEDVLHTLATVPQLAGIVVVTIDPLARSLAERYGARVVTDGARDGHTGAVTSAARLLARERLDGMITLPGDIPRIQASEVTAALAAHKSAPAFTIVPAHDELGSNAIICSPPDAVPFRFGEDSFFPHLDAARRAGIAPSILHQPGIAMDIDHPADLLAFLQMSPRIPTRTLAFLEQSGIAGELLAEATAAR
ncbi:2-phospho-L-lactate guanylyltransferase [Acidisoma sp. L85]|jgi:2-phospho-L-lactate guanylyltransferase|uniref:2-phospho-L-lactate guanylyltransferase n=1 Tax=Acidisoma sp. L85 TaxID=1641850 RepID=UPI00131D1904|nr:2-phospho-L-lactate guanylyltransferase [Acidisoma sp. L85]